MVKSICCLKKLPAIHHPPIVMGMESDRCDSSSYRESNELVTFHLDMCPFAHLESQRMTSSGYQVMCNSMGLDSHWVCGSKLSGTREYQWWIELWILLWNFMTVGSSPSHLLPVGLGSEGDHAAQAWVRSRVSPITQLVIFNLENHWQWLGQSSCRGLRDGTF